MPQTAAAAFAGETKTLVQALPLNVLMPDAQQVRRHFDEDALQQLAASIREHGVIQPIVVRPIDKTGQAPYEIIAGERRWRASQIAGLAAIPAVIRADLIGQDVRVLQILENLQRADLSLQETAAGVSSLVKAIGNTKAAQQLGKSEAWVSKHARITQLPKPVLALVEAGKLESADMAHDLAQLNKLTPDGYWARQAMNLAEEGMLHRAELREYLTDAQQEAERAKARAEAAKAAEKKAQEAAKSPAHAARVAEADRKEAERVAALTAAQKEKHKRHASLISLQAACRARLVSGVEALEQALGVRAQRAEDTGEINFDNITADDEITLALTPDLPAMWMDTPIPGTPEQAAYRLEMVLDYRQLQLVLTRLAGGTSKAAKPAASTERQGDLDVGSFITERLDRSDPKARIQSAALHSAYAKWCKALRLVPVPMSAHGWGQAIEASGIQKTRFKTGIHYIGVTLKE